MNMTHDLPLKLFFEIKDNFYAEYTYLLTFDGVTFNPKVSSGALDLNLMVQEELTMNFGFGDTLNDI